MPIQITAGELPLNTDRSGAEREEFFEARVRPVLASHCLECHGVEKHKGSLRLDARDAMLKGGETGPVVVPGPYLPQTREIPPIPFTPLPVRVSFQKMMPLAQHSTM